MADWIQSASLMVHGRSPEESRNRRSRRKGRSDDKPFDQILTSAARHEGESEGSGSTAFTSSRKNKGASRRGKKGGRSRANAYSEITTDPAMDERVNGRVKMANHLYIPLQQQQYLSDSDGEPTGCWGAAQRMLCGCYTSRRTEQRIRAQADQRYYEFRRMEEEEKLRELQRQMDLVRQDETRQIREVEKKYEARRKEEQKKRELQRLKEVVRQEWARAIASQTWRLTEEEGKELERLRKQEGALHRKIQRLREKEAMPEMGTCTESEDVSGDERGQQRQMEKYRWPHLEHQQLGIRRSETLSKPQLCVSTGRPVNWLWSEEDIELLQRLREQQDSILLKIKNLEDKQTKPKNQADKLRLEGTRWQAMPGSSETSRHKISNLIMEQTREAVAEAGRMAQLEEVRELERDQERWREMERMRETERRKERELEEEWSRRLEGLKCRKAAIKKDMEKEWSERKRTLEKEHEERVEKQRQLEMQEQELKDRKERFAKEREMEQKSHEEAVSEMMRRFHQEMEAKLLKMNRLIEKDREMSQRREEALLIEHQQKMEALRHTERKMEKERHLDMHTELKQVEVECQDLGSEMKRGRECPMREQEESTERRLQNECEKEKQREQEKDQEMEEELKKMEQKIEMEREMERKTQETRRREIEEKRQKEWEERERETQEARRREIEEKRQKEWEEREREMERETQEARRGEIEEKRQKEWEERQREMERKLEAEREVAQPQDQEMLMLGEKQQEAKEQEWMKVERQREIEREEKTAAVVETHRKPGLEKEMDEGKAWMREIKQEVKKQQKLKEKGTENEEKIANVGQRKPTTEGIGWLGELKQKRQTIEGISPHDEQPFLQDTSVTRKLKKENAQTERRHEELDNDWLGGVDLMKSQDKWSEIRRKHQQSREESRQELEKQGDQGQQTETNKCAVVSQRRRPVARNKEQTLTELNELNQQDRKELKTCRNEGMDCLGEMKQRVVKGRRGRLQEGQQIMDKELFTQERRREGEEKEHNKNNNNNNNNSILILCNARFTVKEKQEMLEENQQRENVQQKEQRQRQQLKREKQKLKEVQVELEKDPEERQQKEMERDNEVERWKEPEGLRTPAPGVQDAASRIQTLHSALNSSDQALIPDTASANRTARRTALEQPAPREESSGSGCFPFRLLLRRLFKRKK